jgi:hypothetical protein
MIYKVYHDKTPTFGFGGHREFNDDNFEYVATVESDSHQDVFRITNHIDHDWWDNPEVKDYKDETRSTSVGDVVVDEDGKRFRVEMAGWTEF